MSNQLDLLLADGIVNEVLGRLQSGKEADVYLVRRGEETLAAKVYKERDERSFKNNTAYKEERKVRNSRTQRAVDRGSRFGKKADEEEWKSSEANALYRLHAQGWVRVPTPVMFYEGVLLMQLVTDAEGYAAPRLIDAPLTEAHAGPMYLDLRRQLIGMLCCEVIHADLSPYNILLGADGPTIIDFPQMISAAHNRQSEMFFLRDFDNLFRFFCKLDNSLARLAGDAQEIWRVYLRRELTPDFIPPIRRIEPRRPPPPEREARGPASQDRGARGPSFQQHDARGPRPQQGGPGPRQPGPPDARPQQGGPSAARPQQGGPAGARPQQGGPSGARPPQGGPSGGRPPQGGPSGPRQHEAGPGGQRPPQEPQGRRGGGPGGFGGSAGAARRGHR